MLIKNGSRQDAIHALINLWLKDSTKSCAWCGEKYEPGRFCCEQPFPATNMQIMQQFSQELKDRREIQKNKFASTDDKSMRASASIPAGLYMFLDSAMHKMYNEGLFTKEYPPSWFAKNFQKVFGVAEVV